MFAPWSRLRRRPRIASVNVPPSPPANAPVTPLATLLAVTVALFGAQCTPAAPDGQGAPEAPQSVIVLIADGAGVAHWTLAKFERDQLAIDRFPVVGLVDTRGHEHTVTGSAPGATAIATGVHTFMGAVGVGPDSLPRETALEAAMARGRAAGLVTTTWVADATPASFGAHVPNRGDFTRIMQQMGAQGIEVILGGGQGIFEFAARDSVDLRTELEARYQIIESAEAFEALDPASVERVLGLFARGDMPRVPDRSPSLTEMMTKALAILERDPDGFFLMVENEGSDTEAHRNVDREILVTEMVDFDDAVAVALEFQERHPETLVLVTSDHETGGVSLPYDQTLLNQIIQSKLDSIVISRGGAGPTAADSAALRAHLGEVEGELRTLSRAPILRYETGGHTGAMVPLFAIGPGAERFGGVKENREVGRILLDLIRE